MAKSKALFPIRNITLPICHIAFIIIIFATCFSETFRNYKEKNE